MTIQLKHPDQLPHQARNWSGNKYGRLEFLLPTTDYSGNARKWLTVCDCGNLSYVDPNDAKKGDTKSCGCWRRERMGNLSEPLDLTGDRFGRLVALRLLDERLYGSHTVWECRCDCGATTEVLTNSLYRGLTRSCGCLSAEKTAERARAMVGENHPNWKGGITEENTAWRNSQEYRDWRWSVYRRDQYTCQKCKDDSGGNLVAHHILPFSEYEDERLNVANGITLCESCHDSFHDKYGWRGGFNDVDFEEWMN